jgi:hypothetical protein
MTHAQKTDALIATVKKRGPETDAFVIGYLASWLVTISEADDTWEISSQIQRLRRAIGNPDNERQE